MAQKKLARTRYPYLSVEPAPVSPWTRAAARGSPWVLETNIGLLPDTISHTSDNVENMLSLEAANRKKLGNEGAEHYVKYALSNAVDIDIETSFRSPQSESIERSGLTRVLTGGL